MMPTIHNNHMFFNYYGNHLRLCVEPLAKSKCIINGSNTTVSKPECKGKTQERGTMSKEGAYSGIYIIF